MDIPQRCQEIRAQVEGELSATHDEEARTEILVQGLYQLNDLVLAEMGKPGRSERYLKGQSAALDLIVFLALPLVRVKSGTRDLVSLLVEVAEGCSDPVLEKKLTGYAKQVLSQSQREEGAAQGSSGIGWYIAGTAAVSVVLISYLLLSLQPPKRTSVLSRDGGPGARSETTVSQPLEITPYRPPVPHENGAPGAEAPAKRAMKVEMGEHLTKIKVVASQVLVPVIVKNGGESVKVTLLLDTGSTRTALGEQFAAKLGVDLTRARGSLVEVADGRVLHSKLATVDVVAVGSRALPSFELEFFPYNGSDQGFDGFLGMDFLGRQRYQIDVENEVIRWF
ncbi:retroviral-like aspartic protease family protein [Geomonas sp. RF6]|uniref:retropepsin-like aspartic protease n=1 Tax=Geomonas sp. RF6 TaxID=2897342 RepID=UPI001E2926AD|nr:retropepsin-like aspartic protease [Geomonas sp. RF6]UFS72296.1 retroviral-like aspartic protease family protein [Geomonas sp. RF6]